MVSTRPPPPPILLIVLVGLGILIGLFLSPPALVPWPLNLIGLFPLAGGILLLKSSFDLFGRSNTSPDPESVPKALITEGPYRWVRNPIYIGFGLIQLGLAILFASVAILSLLPVYLLSVHIGFVLREERVLEEQFSEEYQAYRKTVPRWLPRRPSRQDS